ncbi:MAG: radical SAM protein [Candidatus Magasanikbacteria bacterium]|nr:radical SAM protein [Candidatus Magasanikbacteria bacterium]
MSQTMKIVKSLKSNDGKTTKYLQKTKDGHIIEAGYYNLDEHIICISSQIGCLMGCVFCATTAPVDSKKGGLFVRNLTSEETVQQVKNVILRLKIDGGLSSKKILFSYMGMGEPFLNYKNVVDSIKILSKKFPNSRTTISTLGISPGLIKKLAREKINTLLKLHLSLHAPNNTLRKKILPKSQKIQPALNALKYFSSIRGVPATVNYILIKNVNDSQKQAAQLARLLKPYPFKVKLSNLNNFNNMKSSGPNRFAIFEKTLSSAGIKTDRFFSIGTDVKGGCGQLKRHYYANKNQSYSPRGQK